MSFTDDDNVSEENRSNDVGVLNKICYFMCRDRKWDMRTASHGVEGKHDGDTNYFVSTISTLFPFKFAPLEFSRM